MKSIVVFACILYCCQAGVVNDVVIDGKKEELPQVTDYTTSKTDSTVARISVKLPIGPTKEPTTKPTTNPTKPTSSTITPTTKPTHPTTEPTHPTTEPTHPTTKPTQPTTKPTQPTTEPTQPTTKPTQPTTVKPSPSSTKVPVTSTVIPPTNRGFDGPSFIGGIVLASGLMAIGFVALKFYKARTELNYHTL